MDLSLARLRSTLMRMSHALRRFQRERGMTLARPVAANSPLQSYFVDPDFAAVAAHWMFGERIRTSRPTARSALDGSPSLASRENQLCIGCGIR